MSITFTALRFLVAAGGVMIDAFFPKQYPEAALARKILGIDHWGLDHLLEQYKSPREAKRTLSSILNRLKRQGLVVREGSSRRAVWRITLAGRRYFQEQEKKDKERMVSLPRSDGLTRIVSFDVPERERKKRQWLRTQLGLCGYKPLQKSVFLGDCPLPADFIKQVDLFGLGDYVHVVRVEQKGTLEE